jgi:hypothetical protein
MRLRLLAVAVAATALLVFGAAHRPFAQTAAPSAAMVPDDELAALFSAFCLEAFPAAASLDRVATARKAVVMKPEEVTSILHSDPGRGWMLRTPQALYGITIEYPPYNGCAVRRMTPVGVSGVKNYIAAINAYVAARNGKLVNLPPQKSATPGGADISMYGQGMVDASGKPSENFAVILTNYHGRPGGVWRADAGTGVGVEVRFVHQFVKQ